MGLLLATTTGHLWGSRDITSTGLNVRGLRVRLGRACLARETKTTVAAARGIRKGVGCTSVVIWSQENNYTDSSPVYDVIHFSTAQIRVVDFSRLKWTKDESEAGKSNLESTRELQGPRS